LKCHKHKKKLDKFHFSSAGCSLLRAEGLSCTLDLSKLKFLIKKRSGSEYGSTALTVTMWVNSKYPKTLALWVRLKTARVASSALALAP
jgi:hypothetical protein